MVLVVPTTGQTCCATAAMMWLQLVDRSKGGDAVAKMKTRRGGDTVEVKGKGNGQA
jgi:hypothetical protein